MNAEQEITGDIGVFARLGWNDGKTESFAFTAIDRLATGGVSINGKRWHRPFDTVATELTASRIFGVHALYLARGGYDFLIGDVRLRYGPECVSETYYSVRVFVGFSRVLISSTCRTLPTTATADRFGFPRSGFILSSERTLSPVTPNLS